MGEKEYLIYLSAERLDRFRYFHQSERGRIIRFSIQYEAFLDLEWRAGERDIKANWQRYRSAYEQELTQ